MKSEGSILTTCLLIIFYQYNLKLVGEIKGLDPNHFFIDHMTSVDFSVSLANSFLFREEEGDSQDPQAMFAENKQEDIKTVISTTDQHRQRGSVINERSILSPNVSQKSSQPKPNSQSTSQEQKKSSMDNFDDGGDHEPPKGSLERPHKLL
jgi:hypothetical protein